MFFRVLQAFTFLYNYWRLKNGDAEANYSMWSFSIVMCVCVCVHVLNIFICASVCMSILL